ncbi:MAG: HD family phosphohydrolase [Bacteroidales bacterium]|nr:HD family phosphohydrolase [Bacteroidales bacterium]
MDLGNLKVDKVKENKEEFCRLLRSTKRDGVEYVIEDLESLGFFEAPASTRFHLCNKGGLVEHSLNVCKAALELLPIMHRMRPDLKDELREDSVILCSLLHDVNKAEIYKPVVKKRKNAMGVWEDYDTYDVDFSNFPMGHGEKSVIVLLLSGLQLKDSEMLAIRWHMAAWDLAFQSPEAKSNINAARDKYPLCGLIQCADTLAANILEHTDKEEE